MLELQGAGYEELEKTYNRARQLAQQASSLKLEATVMRSLEGVQKLKGHHALARECFQTRSDHTEQVHVSLIKLGGLIYTEE